MARLALSQIGARVGASLLPGGIPGTGISGAELGRNLGAYAGTRIDQALAGPVAEGPRLDGLTVMESREGAGVARVFGKMRIGGQVIWATHLKERSNNRPVGGKGGPTVTEYSYSISFAVGLCEGVIQSLDRVWANGQLLDLSGLTWRLYKGDADQSPDPIITATEGAAPAYRDLVYIVFEDFPLDEYGARLPQLSFEVTAKPESEDTDNVAQLITGVNLIPASGAWVYSPTPVNKIEFPGWETPLNRFSSTGEVDIIRALDQMQAELPNLTAVNLVIAWFGDDLRAGLCQIKPGIESRDELTRPLTWSAGGIGRESAHLISTDADGRSAYGASPDDNSIKVLIAELKSRGLAVTLSPFILMDIPAINTLPDPVTGVAPQAAHPWRGRITTASPGTSSARQDVSDFFGSLTDWGYRRFVQQMATLGVEAGGVSRILLGSELVGLTRIQDDTGAFPAVSELIALAGEVRSIVGSNTEISYAADWTEYGGFVPEDRPDDLYFPLDPLWADGNIDSIGIDWYAPLSDWRDGDHLDRAIADQVTDQNYLQGQIEGGEGFDWFYASDADRDTQTRTPITDGAYNEPWVYRVKDLRNWWSRPHHERINGVRRESPTAYSPQSKPIRLFEVGCGAVDKGTNAPNVFYDPKSAESGLPPYSNGIRDDDIQAAALIALHAYWNTAGPNNPISAVYDGPMIPSDGLSVWAYDARPFPAFPARTDVWSDGQNWATGHWLNGRLSKSSLGDMIEALSSDAGITVDVSDVSGRIDGYAVYGLATLREWLAPFELTHSLTCQSLDDHLKFATRPNPSTLHIEHDHLVEEVTHNRTVTEHGIRSVRLTALDPHTDYQPVSVRTDGTVSEDRDIRYDLPLVFDTAQLTELSLRLHDEINAAGQSMTLTLSPDLLLSPGDRLTVEDVHADQTIQTVNLGDTLVCNTRPHLGALGLPPSTPVSGGSGRRTRTAPHVVVLDLPARDENSEGPSPWIAAFAKPWPGSVTVSAGPDAATLSERATCTEPALIGRLMTVLPAGPAGRIRPGLTLEIEMPDAPLSSLTKLAALAGQSPLAVRTPEGWLILSYEGVDQIGPHSLRLSGIITGLAGTDPQSEVGAVAGSECVILNTALTRATLADHERGLPLEWQATSSDGGQSTQTATVVGRSIAPIRPGHMKHSVQPNGDWRFTWTRRARHSEDSWASVDAPLLEAFERYDVSISYDGQVIRTDSTSTPTWTYKELDRQTDKISGPVTITVAQISDRYGPGEPVVLTIAEAAG